MQKGTVSQVVTSFPSRRVKGYHHLLVKQFDIYLESSNRSDGLWNGKWGNGGKN